MSFDFELIWGTLDIFGPDGFAERCRVEREEVVPRLVDLLDSYEIPATWLTVGHLMLEQCDGRHVDAARPRHAWVDGDWFAHDKGGDEQTAPNFFGRSLLDRVRAARTPQEIGSHSFSHVIFGDEGCGADVARSELQQSCRLGEQQGLSLKAFAFPRNVPGHLDVLVEFGVTCFRGPDPNWYRAAPHAFRRVAHMLDVVLAATPPTVWPRRLPNGLVDVPGSMIFLPYHGVRRHIPMSRRVLRARKGLDAAARTGRIFHLWMHPTNLVDGLEDMFGGLTEVFAHARRLRDEGRLAFITMSEAAALAPAV